MWGPTVLKLLLPFFLLVSVPSHSAYKTTINSAEIAWEDETTVTALTAEDDVETTTAYIVSDSGLGFQQPRSSSEFVEENPAHNNSNVEVAKGVEDSSTRGTESLRNDDILKLLQEDDALRRKNKTSGSTKKKNSTFSKLKQKLAAKTKLNNLTQKVNEDPQGKLCFPGENYIPKPCYYCHCGFNGYYHGWMCVLDERCRSNQVANMNPGPSFGGGGASQRGDSVVKTVVEVCHRGMQYKDCKVSKSGIPVCRQCICAGNGVYQCKQGISSKSGEAEDLSPMGGNSGVGDNGYHGPGPYSNPGFPGWGSYPHQPQLPFGYPGWGQEHMYNMPQLPPQRPWYYP